MENKEYLYDVFVICPVRNASEFQKAQINDHIKGLEDAGNVVYYPARDTDQDDTVGYKICSANRNAINESKEVHLYWDKESSGSLFDLGMAFSLRKRIIIINPETMEKTETKSFENMVKYWSYVNN